MSKTPEKNATSKHPAQRLLEADVELVCAADAYTECDDDSETDRLRQAAIAFADAWRACGVTR
jgi:hypothetical protein